MSFGVASLYNFRKFINRFQCLDFVVRKSEENDSPRGWGTHTDENFKPEQR